MFPSACFKAKKLLIFSFKILHHAAIPILKILKLSNKIYKINRINNWEKLSYTLIY